MKKASLNLPVSNLYTEGPLKIEQHEVHVEMELTAGDHVITSESVEIGNYFNYSIFAYISIPYSYDPDLQYVTIAGPDDMTDRQLSIHTYLGQNQETSYVHRLNSSNGLAAAAPNFWVDVLEKSADLRQVGKIVIRQAITNMVKQLLDAGVQGVIQQGTAPVVTPDNYRDYKNMFLPQKVDVQEPALADILEVQAIINSTYGGTITWSAGYKFANIIGSTHDPKPSGYSSWIKLWNDKCHGGYYTTHCSSHNYSNGNPGFPCGTSDFVGGHVIPGTTAKSVPDRGTAYIFPICKPHNNNDNIYMSTMYNPKGVVLKNYNRKLFFSDVDATME